ncbi:pentatricopeptide repeat-containing protein At1g03540-like [Nymphaea colorata]|nr:pentatricopeptide repeat-containing protein At1g03540-like [Nymphaea colorata]XP_049937033.1 pentatricopeptide repeat-containing protein At1g03540-like [Nymphaea colorata]
MPNRIDIPTYSSLLDFCLGTKNLPKLLQTHGRLVVHGISHHDFLRAKLAAAYASCGRMQEAGTIFSWTNKQSTFLHNAMIRGYTNRKGFRRAFEVYCHLLSSGRRPDNSTFSAILKASANWSALQIGRQIHGVIFVCGVDSDILVGNTLITMYGKCGCLERARQVFDEMCHRNLISWSSMVGAYAMHGLGNDALKVFEEMRAAGEEPDEVVLTSVLAACWHSGMVERGLEYWKKMEVDWGLKRKLEHYTCVVGLLGRDGLFEQARRLVEEMEWEPDGAVWRVLLGICNIRSKPILRKLAYPQTFDE